VNASARGRCLRIVLLLGGSLTLVASGASCKPPGQSHAPISLQLRHAPLLIGPHEHNVTAVAFSPDGKTLATGSGDGNLRLWDVASGKLNALWADDANRGIDGLAFAPDGRRILEQPALLATWVPLPRDERRGWSDEWVGYAPSGIYVGSNSLDRLIGWQRAGATVNGPQGDGIERVERLFDSVPESSN
jgi:hypothetical protein